MAHSGLLACVALPLMLCVLTCQGGGKVEIKMTRYRSSCRDNLGSGQCDTYFYLCIDKPGPLDLNCYYRKYGPSHQYDNTNSMDFGSDVGGIPNPMIVNVSRFDSRQVMFVVQAHDDEMWQSDQLLVTVGKTVTLTPALTKASSTWSSAYMSHDHYHVWFEYRAYCDAHYYGSECDVYCESRDDSQGHYTCDVSTGNRTCLAGWQGDNCSIDTDECGLELPPCQNNAGCSNLPGSYQCDCDNGFTGQDCDVIASGCHSAPCLNNGTCSGDLDTYNCSCSDNWTGQHCETQVDMCLSEPCRNNATCLATGTGNYTCACAAGWQGENCSRAVDPCEDNPCGRGRCLALGWDSYLCACVHESQEADCDCYYRLVGLLANVLTSSP